MATVSNFALRVPPSLMEDVRSLAAQDAVSVNQFLIQAAAEKVAGLKARGELAARAARARPGAMELVLAKAGTATALPGDEIPEAGGR
ncbi:MAG TPA: toxin-antitoxin system HicB family antitoxin [Chloroflexota bacterium]|nr:toxin-antitoxin system HicB family antitoxin [Chloroflexota bacterium]